jgi:hypothetical protein
VRADQDLQKSQENDTLTPLTRDSFYRSMVFAAALAPEARREHLLEIHRQVLDNYVAGLMRISPEQASRRVPDDGRTLGQVVGHILEWDRALLISFGEILAGVRWPRIMLYNLNVDIDGESHEFKTTDAFNAFYAEQQAGLPWVHIRARALEAAHALYGIFSAPGLLTSGRLESTRIFSGFGLPTGETLEMPCGWYLWMTTLEHEAVEHADALRA